MYLYELVLSNPLFVGLFKGNIKCDQDWLLSLPHLLLQTNYDTTAPSRGHPCHQQHWPELNIYWGSLTLSIVVVLDPDLNEAKLFTSDILKLPKHIQTKLLKKHEENLKIASKHLEKLRRSHQLLTNSHLKTLKKLLNLNKVKFTDVTSSLRRQLPIPGGEWRIDCDHDCFNTNSGDLYNDLVQTSSNMVPSIIKYSGTMVPSILNYSMEISREMVPEVIQEGVEFVPSILEYGGRVVPPLLRYGGDMVNSVWSNPGQLQVSHCRYIIQLRHQWFTTNSEMATFYLALNKKFIISHT